MGCSFSTETAKKSVSRSTKDSTILREGGNGEGQEGAWEGEEGGLAAGEDARGRMGKTGFEDRWEWSRAQQQHPQPSLWSGSF